MLVLASASSTPSSPNFLVPNGTFIFELVIFIVVLGIVAKFILPPIQKVMNEREGHIRAGLNASDSGRFEADRLAEERRHTLEQARSEARAVLEAAGRSAAESVEEARRRGQSEYERLVGEADVALVSERVRLRNAAFGRAGVLIVEAAEQVIGAEIDRARHSSEIDRAIANQLSGT